MDTAINRQDAVAALRAALMELLRGKTAGSYRSPAHEMHFAIGLVNDVEPPANPADHADWRKWIACIVPLDGSSPWNLALNQLLDEPRLDALFREYLGDPANR